MNKKIILGLILGAAFTGGVYIYYKKYWATPAA